MKLHIVIQYPGDHVCLPIDTPEQVEAAQNAMLSNGLSSLRVYVGDPDDPDMYCHSTLRLRADATVRRR